MPKYRVDAKFVVTGWKEVDAESLEEAQEKANEFKPTDLHVEDEELLSVEVEWSEED